MANINQCSQLIPQEQLICANKTVHSEDALLNLFYKKLLLTLSENDRNQITQEQKQWLKKRNQLVGQLLTGFDLKESIASESSDVKFDSQVHEFQTAQEAIWSIRKLYIGRLQELFIHYKETSQSIIYSILNNRIANAEDLLRIFALAFTEINDDNSLNIRQLVDVYPLAMQRYIVFVRESIGAYGNLGSKIFGADVDWEGYYGRLWV